MKHKNCPDITAGQAANWYPVEASFQFNAVELSFDKNTKTFLYNLPSNFPICIIVDIIYFAIRLEKQNSFWHTRWTAE